MTATFRVGCRRRFRSMWLLAACAAAVPGGALAEDPTQKPPATLREMIDAAMNEVRLFRNIETKEAAKPIVALRWANNARGSEDGTTLLYVHRGRPLAVECLYPWEGDLVHDFELLTSERTVGRREGRLVWQPRTLEVKFADVPGAPPPEATAAQRFRQMRSLAAEFQSTMLGWKADDTDREELRLLPRPLYRYEFDEGQGGDSVFDGAVFAFVMGTDPESLLLLEAVTEDDASKWRFAFARRTSGGLEGRHRGKVVWTAARFPYERDERSPHFTYWTKLPANLAGGDTKPEAAP